MQSYHRLFHRPLINIALLPRIMCLILPAFSSLPDLPNASPNFHLFYLSFPGGSPDGGPSVSFAFAASDISFPGGSPDGGPSVSFAFAASDISFPGGSPNLSTNKSISGISLTGVGGSGGLSLLIQVSKPAPTVTLRS